MTTSTETGSFSSAMAEPLLFHPLKHHLQFIKAFIAENEITEAAVVKSALRAIGNSQLDLYVGQLTL